MVQWLVMRSRHHKRTRFAQPVSWLPVDSRLILPLFSFGHVKGMARLFLEIEILLSLLVVGGTLVLFLFAIVGPKA
ncbi:hypothetical protein HY031_00585 [Candidatus Gottesmanbacteria bacterium]|nr:hypothetical protein [Candidatus Gottesmanbacteria bacterium]